MVHDHVKVKTCLIFFEIPEVPTRTNLEFRVISLGSLPHAVADAVAGLVIAGAPGKKVAERGVKGKWGKEIGP